MCTIKIDVSDDKDKDQLEERHNEETEEFKEEATNQVF
jgi:hypothetical protein